ETGASIPEEDIARSDSEREDLDPLQVLSDQALIPIVTTREPNPRPTSRTRYSRSPPTDQGDPEGL
ncbi:hypothetical protein Taro_054546, partial [Colocasia esculenta]|nr:hypothetical protein [Colocasia esculenta]